MVSPYAGWADINSFLDHDSPNYALDGKIIIANGLVASTAFGQESDLFPAYWSPILRQYVNYDGHNGYDFGISYQPVLAAGDGKILFAGWNEDSEYGGYGQMILIDHRNGYQTLYGHLSKLEVKSGDTVTAGQEIGISGSTGHSSGPHLHFSVFHNCQVTDPYGWTGRGPDALQSFDGENSQYLWLPGHEPLVLNPPPNWPTFPLGLHLSLPVQVRAARIRRNVPPADRLLLLALPTTPPGVSVPESVALARTESTITRESEALAPWLNDLESQGLVEDYAAIPSAAAVWVRGTASAAELEALPGVASLAGVQPADVSAAAAGLSHSVLIQVGHLQAPSMWPVGFRSALHAWRPLATVSTGHALVAGFALPGQRVVISLRRGGTVPAAAEARGDAESGGFVAMLHDQAGNEVPVQAGDTVTFRTGSRSAQVRVSPLSIKSRSRQIRVDAAARSTVPILVASPSGAVAWHSVGATGRHGSLSVQFKRPLLAGTLGVAVSSDAAGNEEAASAVVPGVVVTEGGSDIRGWAVGRAPQLRVIRAGHVLFGQSLSMGLDGSFDVVVRSHGRRLALQPGDTIAIGSPNNQRLFVLPRLGISLTPGNVHSAVVGPGGESVTARLYRVRGPSQSVSAALSAAGSARVTWPSPPRPGDTASVQLFTPRGDEIVAETQPGHIDVRTGSPAISGWSRPDTAITIEAWSARGKRLGGVLAATDGKGSFSGTMTTASGQSLAVRARMRIQVQEGDLSAAATLPTLSLSRSNGEISPASHGYSQPQAGTTARSSRKIGPGIFLLPSKPPRAAQHHSRSRGH